MEDGRKTVVIMGACGGIGSELALVFKDTNLVLIDRNEEKLRKCAPNIGGVQLYGLDLTSENEIETVATKIVNTNPVVDVLINAAGVGVYKTIEDVEYPEWTTSMSINVDGPYFLTKNLLPSLKNSKSAYVVNLGSGMSKIPTGGRSAYCTSKFALRGMTLSLAEEFDGTNVRFLHMVLGSVLTDFGPMSRAQKKERSLSGKSYLTPKSVAEKIYNLVEEETKEKEIEFAPSGYDEPINR
ncbi:SDR family oxidoreductase [Patescibacteria group bacterium]